MAFENEFQFAECAKPIANTGKNRRLRVLLVCSYILFAALYCILFTALIMIPHLIAILPLLLWIGVYFTWGFVSYECAVRVCAGEVVFLRLRGKKEKKLLSLPIKELFAVAPYAAPYTETLANGHTSIVLDHRADKKEARLAYFAVWQKNGKNYAVLFDSAAPVVRALRYYNKNTVWDEKHIRL